MYDPSNNPEIETGNETGLKPRRGLRHPLDGPPTTLSNEDHPHVVAKIRNVSCHGFMADCLYPMAIGSQVALHIPGIGAVDAQVRWQIGLKMGGMFLDPINLDQCEWVATRSRDQA